MYKTPAALAKNGYAFRYGKWKLAVGGVQSPGPPNLSISLCVLYELVW